MEEKYLDALTLKIAYRIFDEAMEAFKYPHDFKTIEKMWNYIDYQIKSYDKQKQPLLREHLRKLYREYRSECQYYDLCYR